MKKILSLTLALCMILTLCACGGAKEEAPAAEAAPAFTTIEAGVLKCGTNAAFPPYEFISDEDGETIVGIDAEIAGAIAEKLGLKLVVEDMEFGSIITSVQSGKLDMGFGAITVTEERKQNVDFTDTYSTGIQSIIVPEGSPIVDVDGLAGAKIGVQESTTGHIYCEDEFGADNVIAFSTGANAVEALISGKVDAVVIDNAPAKAYVEANKGLVLLETAYAVEDYAFPMGKDNPELFAAVNAALKELIADGTVAAIVNKYIPVEDAPAEAAPVAFTTIEDGVLKCGTNAAFPPYEFISDEDGETIVGIDAEIAGAIAEKLGLELQIEDMEFGSIITSVQTGKLDMGFGAITVTEERKQNVDFTDTYSTGIQSIIVVEGSPITCVDDLAGKKIGVQESTTGHIYCEDEFGADNVIAYSTGANAVEALISGKVDAVVIDNAPAQAFVEANKGLVVLETPYAEEDYAFPMSKDNPELFAAVNAALKELIADGTVGAIVNKYIPAE